MDNAGIEKAVDALSIDPVADAEKMADKIVADEKANPPLIFGSKQQVLAADDITYKDVYVKAWGFYQRLKKMTGRERDAFENSLKRDVPGVGGQTKQVRNHENIRARLLARTMVDANNNNTIMFSTPEDIMALGNKAADALSELFDEACILNGITKADQKALEGNSDETDGDSELI